MVLTAMVGEGFTRDNVADRVIMSVSGFEVSALLF